MNLLRAIAGAVAIFMLVNSHDHTALGEIWAWAGCGDANIKIAIAGAVAIFMLASPQPAHAQISPNAVWSCEFTNSPTDCGLYLEAAASTRAALVGPGRDGPTAGPLTTPPGDINIAGSGSQEGGPPGVARAPTHLPP